jgi:hypothetical protein
MAFSLVIASDGEWQLVFKAGALVRGRIPTGISGSARIGSILGTKLSVQHSTSIGDIKPAEPAASQFEAMSTRLPKDRRRENS